MFPKQIARVLNLITSFKRAAYSNAKGAGRSPVGIFNPIFH